MQLFSQDAEMRCIYTLVDADIPEKVRAGLLSTLTDDTFHYPPSRAAYQRIAKLAKKRHELIDLDDLVEDPSLDEDFRDAFRENSGNYSSITNKKQIQSLRDTLEEYRKLRICFHACKLTLETLQGDSIQVDEVMDKLSTDIAKARRNLEEDQKILRMGKKSNGKSTIQSVLYKVQDDLIPTGFTEFDTRNGGLPNEGVVILAGTTSGGKSVLAMQLCKNIYLNSTVKKPRQICRVSFEMGEHQETTRLMSNLTGIKLFKFKQNKLTLQEKRKVKETYTKFIEHGKTTGSQFDTVCPTRGMKIEEVFLMLKPYGYNIIAIDYVSLLEGVDEDNQWRMLSAVVRQAKIYSRNTKTLVIVLAQLDTDTDKIRYSRGMKEHADVLWTWNYTKPEQRDMHVIPMKCEKYRDGELFTFPLSERFDIMQINNPSGEGAEYASSSKDVDLSTDDTDDDVDKSNKDIYALS